MPEDHMLSLRNVRLLYNRGKVDEVIALDGLDLDAAPGEFITVVGSNGAGKSSTVQIISGSARPTEGRVFMDGRDVGNWPDYRRARMVARVFDDPRIGSVPELSIEDNFALAASRGRRRGLRFALGHHRRARFRDRIAHLGLGLENRLHDRVGLLSAGQRQSLTVVMAGLVAPKILLLDEHLAALDPATASRVLTLTGELVAEMGCTTLMVTHNMDHAITTGDRLIVMSRGRIVSDVAGAAKARLTPQGVVTLITSAGDAVSDRLLLQDIAVPEGNPS
ncbi:ABC transporter ATP-binding protein [Streptomyces sp. NPDC004629]|uniref:ABC transporter ATP-binding protein n=1 Tax=Streptomyces sp. NPDC004629 TaxID=3364705 RepID=UPI0036CB516E